MNEVDVARRKAMQCRADYEGSRRVLQVQTALSTLLVVGMIVTFWLAFLVSLWLIVIALIFGGVALVSTTEAVGTLEGVTQKKVHLVLAEDEYAEKMLGS